MIDRFPDEIEPFGMFEPEKFGAQIYTYDDRGNQAKVTFVCDGELTERRLTLMLADAMSGERFECECELQANSLPIEPHTEVTALLRLHNSTPSS